LGLRVVIGATDSFSAVSLNSMSGLGGAECVASSAGLLKITEGALKDSLRESLVDASPENSGCDAWFSHK